MLRMEQVLLVYHRYPRNMLEKMGHKSGQVVWYVTGCLSIRPRGWKWPWWPVCLQATKTVQLPCGELILVASCIFLSLCRAQRPKTSAQCRGQNVPKRLVAIGKLCCFQTRKFLYNLARISWLITVRDFCYFLPCIVFMCEAEVREFWKVESKKRVAGFRDRSLQWYQTTNNSMAFMLKILCFEKL